MGPEYVYIIAAIIAAASAAYGGYVAHEQSSQAEDLSKFNEKVAEEQAKQARRESVAQEEAMRRDQARAFGEARARMGSLGLLPTGSALSVYEDAAADAEYDSLLKRYEGQLVASGLSTEAAGQRWRQRVERGNQTSILFGTSLSVGAAAISGYGDYSRASSGSTTLGRRGYSSGQYGAPSRPGG